MMMAAKQRLILRHYAVLNMYLSFVKFLKIQRFLILILYIYICVCVFVCLFVCVGKEISAGMR